MRGPADPSAPGAPATGTAGRTASGSPVDPFEAPPRLIVLRIADTAAFAVLGFALVALVIVVGRRSRRRQIAAARAAHPGAAVVLTTLVDLASTRLARWAGVTGAVLPDDLAVRGALVADADGLVLRSVGRPAHPLLRWGWDDVDLHEGRRLGAPDVAVLVLTLLVQGERPADAHRRRYDVTLTVRTGHGPVVPGVVEAALTHLLSCRPAPTATATTGTR